jgi:protein-tyrosine phosphatase
MLKNNQARRSFSFFVLSLWLTMGMGVFAAGCSQDASTSARLEGRQVPLEGQANFRDIGGYKTTDGKTVRRGVIYRSGELPHLTDADVARLAELNVKTVVNFLNDAEIQRHGPDRLPRGVQTIRHPIDTDDGMAVHLIDARKTGDFTKVPATINPEIHSILVGQAAEQYAALFRLIADEKNRPLVFHCSHGIHRTGTATAILLWSLGVPWETVREDYLLSNEARKEEVQKRRNQLRKVAAKHQGAKPEDVDMTNIDAFYILQGHYIDATRDEILKTYGSAGNYLRKGLKLSDAEIQTLRANLLE